MFTRIGAVIGYMVRFKLNSASAYSTRRVSGRLQNDFDLSPLTEGELYDASVKARVQPGRTSAPTEDSDYVSDLSFTPLPETVLPKVVDDPRDVEVDGVGDTWIDLDWDVPADTTGLKGYKVTWVKQSGGRTHSQTFHASITSYRIPNLDPNTTWIPGVQALGRTGYDPSEVVLARPTTTDPPSVPVPPSAPAAPTPRTPPSGRITTSSAVLPWTLPVDRTNVDGYVVEVRQSGGTWTTLPKVGPEETETPAGGLSSDTGYEWRVKSVGANGAPDSLPVSGPSFRTRAWATTYQAARVRPVVGSSGTFDTSLRVRFSQSSRVGTAYYRVRGRVHGQGEFSSWGRTSGTDPTDSVLKTRLSDDTSYDIQAQAVGGRVGANQYANSGLGGGVDCAD